MRKASLLLMSIFGAVCSKASGLIQVRTSPFGIQSLSKQDVDELHNLEKNGALYIESSGSELLLTFENRSYDRMLIERLKVIGLVTIVESVEGTHTDGATSK